MLVTFSKSQSEFWWRFASRMEFELVVEWKLVPKDVVSSLKRF